MQLCLACRRTCWVETGRGFISLALRSSVLLKRGLQTFPNRDWFWRRGIWLNALRILSFCSYPSFSCPLKTCSWEMEESVVGSPTGGMQWRGPWMVGCNGGGPNWWDAVVGSVDGGMQWWGPKLMGCRCSHDRFISGTCERDLFLWGLVAWLFRTNVLRWRNNDEGKPGCLP